MGSPVSPRLSRKLPIGPALRREVGGAVVLEVVDSE